MANGQEDVSALLMTVKELKNGWVGMKVEGGCSGGNTGVVLRRGTRERRGSTILLITLTFLSDKMVAAMISNHPREALCE